MIHPQDRKQIFFSSSILIQWELNLVNIESFNSDRSLDSMQTTLTIKIFKKITEVDVYYFYQYEDSMWIMLATTSEARQNPRIRFVTLRSRIICQTSRSHNLILRYLIKMIFFLKLKTFSSSISFGQSLKELNQIKIPSF